MQAPKAVRRTEVVSQRTLIALFAGRAHLPLTVLFFFAIMNPKDDTYARTKDFNLSFGGSSMKIANQFAPYANITPDERYHESNRAWQGAPSIARTRGGRLFVGIMSGGIYEPDPRNECIVLYSDDNGDTWSQPILVLQSSPQALMAFSYILFDKFIWKGNFNLWHILAKEWMK